eukprot:scaffold224384_cov35-Tisochrysis_lutea.AAC.3
MSPIRTSAKAFPVCSPPRNTMTAASTVSAQSAVMTPGASAVTTRGGKVPTALRAVVARTRLCRNSSWSSFRLGRSHDSCVMAPPQAMATSAVAISAAA